MIIGRTEKGEVCMRIVKVSMIIVIAMMLSFLFLESRDGHEHNFVEGMYRNIKEKTTELEEKAMLEKGPPAKEELLQWIGKSSNKLAEIYGEPNRIDQSRSEEHTSALQSRENLVCRLLLEKKRR